MPGYDRNRFVDLADGMADGLTCIVCLNIFNNPVITECGHTYCFECLETNIKSGSNECPKCRKQWSQRRFSDSATNENHVIITNEGQSFLFVRNLIVNSMVNHLKTKCDYAYKGCQSVMELSSLPSHLKECEHHLCGRCGLRSGKGEPHDCLALLKNGLNEYKMRFERCDLLLKEIIDKYSKLEKQNLMNINVWRFKCQKYEEKIEVLKKKVSLLESNTVRKSNSSNAYTMSVEDVEYLMVGTLETRCLHCLIRKDGIFLKGISHKLFDGFQPKDLLIPFVKVQELKYSTGAEEAAIIIKPTELFSFDIQKLLQMDRGRDNKIGFCIYSYEPGKRYIIITASKKRPNLGSTLFEWSTAANPRLNPAIINWNNAQHLLYSALGINLFDDTAVQSVIDSD